MGDEIFPVYYSTLSVKAVIAQVLCCYGIETIKNCQFWHRGLSDVYLIETLFNLYIFRVSHHHWRSKSETDFELELLDFLQQNHIPVAYPLRTLKGELSLEINAPEGKRYAALFKYAPGQVPIGDLNPTQSHKLGEVVAKLHQVGEKFSTTAHRPALTLEYLLDNSLEIISPFLRYRNGDLKFVIEVIGQIKSKLQELPQKPPFWSICWGDPHSGNAHFTAENDVTLFDFDQCGYGWRAFDIAKFWQVSLQSGLSRKVREAFLIGYEEIYKFTALEKSCLQAFTQMAHIWSWAISLSLVQRHDYSRLDESYFNQRLQQLKRLTSYDWQLF